MDPDAARQRLEDERARLEETRQGFDGEHLRDESETDSVSELSSFDQHDADMGTETFEREKDFSILEQVEAELDDVQRALQRIDDGTYGLCEACGKPIEAERLEALPAARFCVKDQAAVEEQAAVGRTTP
jgi:RNA polymerase-binding transcription factor DksA